MKKKLVIACILVLCFFTCVYAEETNVLGDVNQDGTVTLEDARIILKNALRIGDITEVSSSDFLARADMDQNGKVEIADATLALKTALKILPDDSENDADKEDTTPKESTYVVRSVKVYESEMNGVIVSLLLDDGTEFGVNLYVTENIKITKDGQKADADEILEGSTVTFDWTTILETVPGRFAGCTYINIID